MTNEIIEKIDKIASSTTLDESQVVHLFTLARKLIEKLNEADRVDYALLKFYCDWTVHAKIEYSREGVLILSKIHDIILTHLIKKDNSSMGRDLLSILSLDETRQKLNTLIVKSSGGNETFDAIKWSEVILIFVEIISHCPLMIGNSSKLSSIRQQIESKPLKGTSVVKSLSIVKIPSVTFNQNASSDELTYCFLIDTTDTTKFILPLVKYI